MPEMVASNSSQRFSALLDFQRDVDPTYPSHLGGKKSAGSMAGFNPKAAGHHRARHGDDSWQQNWSDSLSAFIASSFRASKPDAPAPERRSCAAEAQSFPRGILTRSQGQFSPQKFIRNALKRAFLRDDHSVMNVKRARFEESYSTAEPMVCG